MNVIKCPHCGKEFEVDNDSYNSIVNEIEQHEIESRIKERVGEIESRLKAEYETKRVQAETSQNISINDLKNQIELLKQKLSNADKDTALAVQKATETLKDQLAKKEVEIEKAKADLSTVKKDSAISTQQLKEAHERELKAKDVDIEYWKNYRMGDSTKDLGESLEQYCHEAFDEIRSVAYPHAYFEKDNDAADGSKGDFIFKDYAEDGTEFISIMFEMKNQKDDTEHKHKNEDFFKKLDKDRTAKKCEYAVLVSTLEEDSKLYNRGIVDVSYRYPKMFVVRPQNFLSIIGLLRSMALNNLGYKQQVMAYQKENVDITNFEQAVRSIAEKINNDYEKAGNIYGEVDKMCDDIVKKVENFRKEFKTATGWIEKAKNQLPELEVRKLTKKNPTMKEKFESLKETKQEEN